MAGYTDIAGVRTWYDERGSGDPLVLLHGGHGSDSRAFEGNIATLADRFHVYLPERRGHGHTADVPGPITFDLMTEDTIAFCEQVVGGPARMVGFSSGAVVALLLALRRPDLVSRLVLVSGVFHRDGWILPPSDDDGFPEGVVRGYAEVSPDGAEHLPVVAAKLTESARTQPALADAELAGVACRTLVLAGDDDLVHPAHTLALYQGIPDAELAVVPGTSHTMLFEKPRLCTTLVADFLCTAPVRTMLPIRRAS